MKLFPSLWYIDKAEEAARFYCSVLPDSRIDDVWTLAAESPSGPSGSVVLVEFTLMGMAFTAMSAGPLDPFNHAVSFTVECDTQDEIDRVWNALGEGGSYEPCGWLKDRYGLSWQIAPRMLPKAMKDPDRVRAGRVAKAMMTMGKLDIARLQAAYDG